MTKEILKINKIFWFNYRFLEYNIPRNNIIYFRGGITMKKLIRKSMMYMTANTYCLFFSYAPKKPAGLDKYKIRHN